MRQLEEQNKQEEAEIARLKAQSAASQPKTTTHKTAAPKNNNIDNIRTQNGIPSFFRFWEYVEVWPNNCIKVCRFTVARTFNNRTTP